MAEEQEKKEFPQGKALPLFTAQTGFWGRKWKQIASGKGVARREGLPRLLWVPLVRFAVALYARFPCGFKPFRAVTLLLPAAD